MGINIAQSTITISSVSSEKTSNWQKYYDIVCELAIVDFRKKYHAATLGYFWSLFNLLLRFDVYHFVFSYLFVTVLHKFKLYTALIVIITMIFDHMLWAQLLTVVSFVMLILLGTGIVLILSTLFIHFRDIPEIWGVILTLGFWLTPIMYNPYYAPALKQTFYFPNERLCPDSAAKTIDPEQLIEYSSTSQVPEKGST